MTGVAREGWSRDLLAKLIDIVKRELQASAHATDIVQEKGDSRSVRFILTRLARCLLPDRGGRISLLSKFQAYPACRAESKTYRRKSCESLRAGSRDRGEIRPKRAIRFFSAYPPIVSGGGSAIRPKASERGFSRPRARLGAPGVRPWPAACYGRAPRALARLAISRTEHHERKRARFAIIVARSSASRDAPK